jgi:hypothetical protein
MLITMTVIFALAVTISGMAVTEETDGFVEVVTES